MIQEKLRIWLAGQIERSGLSIREVAERADLAHSAVNRILQLDNTTRTGVQVSLKLARFFGTPPDVVLELAEILPAKPPESQETRLLVHVYHDLPPDKRSELLRYAQFLRGEK